ncbi:MAG: toxin-antitoxin system YwqK family antitoxin [Flavobacteriales bacterium]
MNTRIALSLTLVTASSMVPVQAQDSFPATVEVEQRIHVLRVDHVGDDLHSLVPDDRRNASTRTVALGSDGRYHVRIRSAQHIQRMEGSYLDSALSIPHGRFVYYHTNGRIESVGDYDHGVKVGTWYTQDITGQGRAERTYTGLALDELLVAQGVHERARTLP